MERDLRGLSVDLLSIDSDHVPATTSWYISTLFPLVVPGGIIIIHDVLNRGVKVYDAEYLTVLGALEENMFESVGLWDGEVRFREEPFPHSHGGVNPGDSMLVLRKIKTPSHPVEV